MATIVFAGDSITAPQYVTEAETFAVKAGGALGYGTVINAAVSGRKAAQLLAALATDVLAHAPQACAVMIGTNDLAAAADAGTPNADMLASYISSMAAIIDQLKAAGVRVLILSPPMSKRAEVNARIAPMVSALADLCASRGVAMIDVAGRMAADARNGGTFLDWFRPVELDLYHLSATGHQRIADLILATQIRPDAGPDQAMVGTALSLTLPASFGNISGQTIRCRVPLSLLTAPPNPVSWMRLKLRAHADEPMAVASLYLGPKASGYAASSLTQVRRGGAASFVIPAGTAVWSDWIAFPWDRASDLLWSMYGNGGAASDKLAAVTGASGAATALKAGDAAAVLAPTGFADYAGYVSLVEAIETDGFI